MTTLLIKPVLLGAYSCQARSLAALTALGRSDWAKVRSKYFASGVNKESLDALESAVFHVSLLLHRLTDMAVKQGECKRINDWFDHLFTNDMQSFWKIWSHKTCKTAISVDSINGKTDDLEIANIFRDMQL